jgi:hypothetical protein
MKSSAKGMAMALTRLLQKKFGSLEVHQLLQIQSAEPTTLETWFDRVLAAQKNRRPRLPNFR